MEWFAAAFNWSYLELEDKPQPQRVPTDQAQQHIQEDGGSGVEDRREYYQ